MKNAAPIAMLVVLATLQFLIAWLSGRSQTMTALGGEPTDQVNAMVAGRVGDALGTDETPVLVAPEAEPFVVVGHVIENDGAAGFISERTVAIGLSIIIYVLFALFALFGFGAWINFEHLDLSPTLPVRAAAINVEKPTKVALGE
jgi:hypothetical protein